MAGSIRIENVIEKQLDLWGLCPFSVVFTFAISESSGLLSITFYINSDLDEFLGKLEYDSLCDKTGIQVLRETNTVLLEGQALLTFYTQC